jgi:hypothetical protein
VKLPAFVPKDLRQLARFVPTSGWDAIEWTPLLGAMREVSTRYVTGRGVASLRDGLSEAVPDITWVKKLRGVERLDRVREPEALQAAGNAILQLYFAQWLNDDGLFIDLRAVRFGLDDQTLHYAPNGLWIRLRPEFREGMVALYQSFYTDDDKAFEKALKQMGMIKPGMNKKAEAELKGLLHSHFGIDQRAQTFSIDDFKASFDELFAFFIEHDYKLHSDFIFVGFYLITLYLTLEEGGQAHDVRSICSSVLLNQ